MKFCKNCVIPETAESHQFNNQGTCSVCTEIKKKKSNIDWVERKSMFEKLIQNYIKKNKYDCIVPFSGGKDSVYALWFLVTQIKMNPSFINKHSPFSIFFCYVLNNLIFRT